MTLRSSITATLTLAGFAALAHAQAPANDACGNAAAITLGSTPFTTINATTDGPTPQATCVPFFPNFLQDVWYRFVPEFAGDLTVSTCGSANYDSKLSAYTGSCGNLTLIGCGEDECGIQSSMTFAVAAGVPVLIRAGGYNNFAVGSGTLNLSQTVNSSFTIPWSTLDCGGGQISGGTFEIHGTIGQTDATSPAAPLSGGSFEIVGGFWVVAGEPPAPPCPQDFNQDGNTDPDDLGDFINCYFDTPPCSRADFNGDSNIDPDDLGDFINIYFGPPC